MRAERVLSANSPAVLARRVCDERGLEGRWPHVLARRAHKENELAVGLPSVLAERAHKINQILRLWAVLARRAQLKADQTAARRGKMRWAVPGCPLRYECNGS